MSARAARRTSTSDTHNSTPITAPTNEALQTALVHGRPDLQGHRTTDEEREQAGHKERGGADLEELFKHLAPLLPNLRQTARGSPKQQNHLADIPKHGELRRRVTTDGNHPKQAPFLALPLLFIAEQSEQERAFSRFRRARTAVKIKQKSPA